MRPSLRIRHTWVLALSSGAVLGSLLWHPTPPQAAPPHSGHASEGARREGALEELDRTRLEQALIRAEGTAALLGLLETHRADGDGRP